MKVFDYTTQGAQQHPTIGTQQMPMGRLVFTHIANHSVLSHAVNGVTYF